MNRRIRVIVKNFVIRNIAIIKCILFATTIYRCPVCALKLDILNILLFLLLLHIIDIGHFYLHGYRIPLYC